AQLDSSQERVVQLERECTLLQQQQTAKSQSLQKAEETCQDLRSRLQRQQRYTLQFKVALEKCLDMSSPHGVTASPERSPLGPQTRPQVPQPQSARDTRHSPVSMPRADRIQPWSAIEGDPLPDPQLAALLRATAPQSETVSDAAPPVTLESSSHAADAQLWQDLERVVEQNPTPTAPVEPVTPMAAATPATPATPATATQPGFTEPFPWGSPQVTAAANPAAATQTEPASPASASAVASPQDPEPDPMPTVTTWQPDRDAARAATINVQPHSSEATVPEIPLLKMPITQGASPSPIVHPLRPQKKKLTSLSAVDLPSFPRPAQNARAN
ncbi:MAG: hypothetical protein HC812_15455, partial [Leptolyngbya sp. RL_3_1]|nr:hypothetical protein [Leptolyngbya sp. RL_3_1]